MKKSLFSILAMVCLIIPGIMMITGCKKDDGTDKTMQISVNPAVSFVVDKDNNIVSVSYENEDAGRIYANVNFVGKDVDSVLQIFIEQSAISGHLDLNAEEVELIVNGSNDEDIQELKNKAKAKIENVFADLGVSVEVSIEELAEAAKKANLVNQALILAPEKTQVELNGMSEEDLVALIKEKQKQYEGLAYTQIETVKSQFGLAQNAILQAVNTLRSTISEIEDAIASLEATLGELAANNPQFQAYKQQVEAKRAEVEQKINQFLQEKQAQINSLKAEYETRKQELVNAFKLEVSAAKTNLIAHLDLAKENGEINDSQYSYWKNLIEANEA